MCVCQLPLRVLEDMEWTGPGGPTCNPSTWNVETRGHRLSLKSLQLSGRVFACHGQSLDFIYSMGGGAVSTPLNQIPLEPAKVSLTRGCAHRNWNLGSSALAECGSHLESYTVESEPSEMAQGLMLKNKSSLPFL